MSTILALLWTMAVARADDTPWADAPPVEAPAAGAPAGEPLADPEALPGDETALETDSVELVREVEPPPKPGVEPGPWLGAMLGVASPASIFDPAGLLRVEAGLVPGILGGRFQPVAAFTLASPKAEGTVDEGEDHIALYEAKQATTTALVGLNVRLFSLKEGVSPELGAAPALFLTRTRVQGSIDGETFSPTVDRSARIGLQAWAGISGRLAGGLITGQIAWSRFSLGGPITGEGHLSTVTPSVGYRMSL